MPSHSSKRKRSPQVSSALTRLVQTHVIEDHGAILDEKAKAAGLSQAAYVRIVILRHLGLITNEDV